MEHILSLSYGKDSMACLGAIEKLGWPLDRIVHAEIWATETIPADLPEMVEFKKKADKIIEKRWGIKVEHGDKFIFDDVFYKYYGLRSKRNGQIYGWPTRKCKWCVSHLKMASLKQIRSEKDNISYVGIAYQEFDRYHNLNKIKKSPLVNIGWTEKDCFNWCKKNDLLSPIYVNSTRGGCWFCPNQSINQLRLLRKNYPEYWALMLKWDNDSPVTFKSDKHTVHDFEKRFALEDLQLIPTNRKFRWKMINDCKTLRGRQ